MDSASDQGILKRLRTKKEQFNLIVDFFETYNEELLDPSSYDQLWINLTERLNEIGPPVHTGTEWKRVWTDHKYNKKRRRNCSNDPSTTPEVLRAMLMENNSDDLEDSNQQLDIIPLANNSCLQAIDDNVPLTDNISFVFVDENQSSVNVSSASEPAVTGCSGVKQDIVLVTSDTIQPDDLHHPPLVGEVNFDFRSEIVKRLDNVDEKLDTVIKMLGESNDIRKEFYK